MERPPFREYQRRAFDFALKNPYSIIALDPRLGKSRISIEIRERLKNNCLIICPSHLILNWEKEIRKWAGDAPYITKITSGKQIYEVCDSDYVITSYDLIQKAENFVEWADMVILDEAHNIKSMDAKRTTFIHKNIFENSVQRVHLLTGSPLVNRVKEFYSLLALTFYNPNIAQVDFLTLYPSEIDFADKFSYREEYTMEINNKWVTILKWSGLQNETELRSWLKDKYIRIRASDVLDMPAMSYKSLYISDAPDLALKQAFESSFNDEESRSVNSRAKADAALKKVPFTVKYVRDLLEEVDCALVYSDHIEAAEKIAEAFNTKAITGKIPGNIRSMMADGFQSGEGKILVSTIGSMKEGKDLFRANDLVLNDYPWIPGSLKQVIARMQSMDKTRLCTVHRMIGSPQDGYIIDVLEEKSITIEKAT